MECKKCGAISPEGVTFCQNCGARLDGKKQCKHCGKFIDEEAVYCGYCGRRTDGKTVCPECGAVAEGDFCPRCGVKVKKEATCKAPQAYDENKELSSYGKVVRYLAPSLTLAAIVILFIFSFFINLTIKSSGSASSTFGNFSGKTDGGVFYFFGDCYSDLSELYANKIPASILIGYILTTTAVVLNFAVCATMLSVAIVKFVKGVSKKERVNLTPFFGWTFGAFVFAACMISGIFGMSTYAFATGTGTSATAESVKIVPSASTLVGIIISVLCVISAIVLQAVAEGKKFLSYNRLGKCICLAVGLILAATVLGIAGENALKVSGKKLSSNGTNSVTTISASLPVWATLIKSVVSGTRINLDDGLYLFGSLSYGVLAVAVSLYIAFAFGSFGKDKGSLGAGITATICGLAALLHLIGAAFIQNDFVNVIFKTSEGVSVSIGGAVAVLVLSAFVVASSITAVVFSKKAARAEE